MEHPLKRLIIALLVLAQPAWAVSPLSEGISRRAYSFSGKALKKIKGLFIEPRKLPPVRRQGLPPRTNQEWLVKGQLTDGEWNMLRRVAMEWKKDIVVCGSLSETPLGIYRRQVSYKNARLAKKYGIPEWRVKKLSKLITDSQGDVDIWEGSGLTNKQRYALLRDVFPKAKKDLDVGYSKALYPDLMSFGGQSGPGALVFKSNGKVERIIGHWQREDL